MNKKFLMNVAIVSIAGILYGSSSSNNSEDSDEIIAAHAAKLAYNMKVNDDGEIDLPPGLEGFEVLGDPHLAGGDNMTQSIALKNDDLVIISYRGTACLLDCIANLGIGYAESYLTRDPIVEHLLEGFGPALTYHGITQEEALAGFFGNDLGPVLGKFLSKGASFAAPVYSAATGLANGASAVKDTVSDAIEFAKNHKPSSTCGAALTAFAAWNAPFLTSLTTVATALSATLTPPVNAVRHFGRTVCGTFQDSLVRGTDSTVASQRQLIFDISRNYKHPYAACIQEDYDVAKKIADHPEYPINGARLQLTGHSMGANRATVALITTQKLKGGRVKGSSSISFARPNGFYGIHEALKDMGASASLQRSFIDETALANVLSQTRVFSHEHDIVARIGNNIGIDKRNIGMLNFLPTPPVSQYNPKRGAKAINDHHSMDGLLKTLTGTH